MRKFDKYIHLGFNVGRIRNLVITEYYFKIKPSGDLLGLDFGKVTID